MGFKSFLLFIGIIYFPLSSYEKDIFVPKTNMKNSITHQKELIGKNRIPSSVLLSGKTDEITSRLVLFITVDSLPEKYKLEAPKIATAIIKEANKYGMDPLFLASVIKRESQFDPDVIGTVGEIGLMQIRPETANWLNEKYKIVKKMDLADPTTNIQIGAFFFNNLREKFKKNSHHYITAYNMGPTQLRRNLKANRKPIEYVQAVMKYYLQYVGMLSTATSKALPKIAQN